MRIVFMGTPEFAVPSLEALVAAGYPVVGVFTQPDRPAGRGNKLTACPVKLAALRHNLPVYQFERLRRREGRETLEALKPDLVVTAAFGQILSPRLLAIPPMGTLNVHASLLPKYRGAAPINRAIAMGETEAGVTIMYTDEGVDTGDMAIARSTPIGETETAGELTERLSHMGADLLVEALRLLEAGKCPRTPQDETLATHQGMLSREDGQIDWSKSAREIDCLVRGMNPWPCACTQMPGGTLKIWRARPIEWRDGGAPGEVMVSSAKQGLVVRCGEGALEIEEMQAPGAKRMAARAYLMGKTLPAGMRLGETNE